MPAAQHRSAPQNRESSDNAFMQDVIDGLNQKQKKLPSKYFYDTLGSKYFDEICDLDEYYPYRTELAMLPAIAQDLSHIIDGDRDIVEFGAGSLVKIRLVLKQLNKVKRYFPIDIAGGHLRTAAATLQKEFNDLSIFPIEADFTRQVDLPQGGNTKKLGFFPGSTIGNFTPEQASDFLKETRKTLGKGALLLIGVDTKKSPEILHLAYNDSQGVTGKFNRNILHHINRKTGTSFDPELFDHYAYYDPVKGRIEMHLISRVQQSVNLEDYTFTFAQGENIHTENSHKYTPEEFTALAAKSGWRGLRKWLGEEQMFGVYLLQSID